MKILMIAGSYPPRICGVGDYSQILSDRLRGLGNTVQVITSSEVSKHSNIFPLMMSWRASELQKIEAFVRKNQPDLIVVQYPFNEYGRYLAPNLAPVLLPRDTGVPVIFVTHEYSEVGLLPKLKQLIGLAFTEHIVATNISDAVKLRKIFWWKEILHIPIAANIPAKSISKKRGRMSFFGIIEPGKGLPEFIDSIDSSFKDILIIGAARDPHYLEDLKKIAKRRGVDGNIRWVIDADRKKISELLGTSEIVVLPYSNGVSERRGSFFAAVENYAAVITTKPLGKSGKFKHLSNVYLIDRADKDLINKAIKDLIKKRKLTHQIAEKAAVDFKAHNWDNVVKRYQSAFKKALR